MGEELTRPERISWALQTSIRNFWFIGAITLITIVMAIRGHIWSLDSADAWNYCMSWLALWIESIVGIAMFNQTRRDAKVLREVKAMEEKMSTVLTHVETLVMHVESLIEKEED
jgi:hypothetical protein